ncbi:MAG: heme ABC transporter ATP-binding protein [Chloroflexota bacterium]
MLIASDICYTINQKEILRDVSLSLSPGELVGVVGPNGAGKSTLLKLLVGDSPPTSGTIQLAGLPLHQWNRRELAKRRGVLMQKSRLSFAFTVFEVVLMGRIPFNTGSEKPEDYDIAEEALYQVGLEKFADRLYTTLSGGEQQRVQLARILAQIWRSSEAKAQSSDSSRYLFLDEPTASLDLAYQQQTLQIAKSLTGENTAVFAILHDLNLASQFADRIVMLKDGKVVNSGTPEDVLQPETIQNLYNTPVFVLAHPETGRPLITV